MAEETQIAQLTAKIKLVVEKYKKEFPELTMSQDYLALKVSEEWGECMKEYLMLHDQGRQKGKSKDEIHEGLSEEFADVFAYLLALADQENVDIVEALEKKWFKYLK